MDPENILTPQEICELAYQSDLTLACFLVSRNLWIVPPHDAHWMSQHEVRVYERVARQVAHYNHHYPKF